MGWRSTDQRKPHIVKVNSQTFVNLEVLQNDSEREVGEEIEWGEERDIKDTGLVAVYGYSDDNVEFRGAINHETNSYDGGTVYLTANGVLEGPL